MKEDILAYINHLIDIGYSNEDAEICAMQMFPEYNDEYWRNKYEKILMDKIVYPTNINNNYIMRRLSTNSKFQSR